MHRNNDKPRETGRPALACALAAPALRRRKETVLAELRERMTNKTALAHGYAYDFEGSGDTLTRLMEFIRTKKGLLPFY